MKPLVLFTILLISQSLLGQKTIPNVNVTTSKGKIVNIQNEIPKDKITIISFWATWCVPCINELDAINEVYSEWQKEVNVELIAISVDDARTQKRIKPMVNGKEWEYKILLDKNQELKRALNISAVPHTIVIKDGKIIYRHSGYTPGDEDDLLDFIKKNAN
ncbi:MAG: TlpA family protein disulfide reductase [Flavobacteriaceae bacterium]|nr:TlpA family protein disulfide reductase [Flavobacteriaceae bacterium]